MEEHGTQRGQEQVWRERCDGKRSHGPGTWMLEPVRQCIDALPVTRPAQRGPRPLDRLLPRVSQIVPKTPKRLQFDRCARGGPQEGERLLHDVKVTEPPEPPLETAELTGTNAAGETEDRAEHTDCGLQTAERDSQLMDGLRTELIIHIILPPHPVQSFVED